MSVHKLSGVYEVEKKLQLTDFIQDSKFKNFIKIEE
jgi:hypothetical protein